MKPITRRTVIVLIVMLLTTMTIWAQEVIRAQDGFASSGSVLRSPKMARAGLYKDGFWNTICLPFDVSVEGSGSPLEGATVMEFDVENDYDGHRTGYDVSDGTLYLFFKTVYDGNLEAGKPYIFKWGNTEKSNEVTRGTVGANRDSSSPGEVTSEDGYVTFRGTFTQVKIDEGGDNTILFIGDGDQLYWPSEAMSIGACHAYFQLNKGLTVGNIANARMVFEEEDPTPIKSLTPNPSPYGEGNFGEGRSATWYTLDGRKLSGKPSVKGIYVKGGKKVLVRGKR